MSDLDYRGQYITGFVDYGQMRELVHECPPLDGAVFYKCVIQYPLEDIKQFFEDRKKVYDFSEYGYISVYKNELSLEDLYTIPTSERGTVTVVGCDIVDDNPISAKDIQALYPIKFKSCNFERLSIRSKASAMYQKTHLFGGSDDNKYTNCTFNLEGYQLFAKDGYPPMFDNCSFENTQLRIEIPERAAYNTVFNNGTFRGCTFNRLRFIRLAGNSKQYKVFSPFFSSSYMRSLDELNVQISDSRISWSTYEGDYAYYKEKMYKDFKSRYGSCDLNMLLPIYMEGQSGSSQYQTKTLTIPGFLQHTHYADLNAYSNESMFTASDTPNNILSRARKYKTLEDFLLNHEDKTRPNMFESYTGYPEVFAEIANSITFSFWQKTVTNLKLGGCKDTLPTQTYQFLHTVFKIQNFNIRNVNLSMTHDLDYADPENITRIENSFFKNCIISFIGIKLQYGVTFNRCTFEDPLSLSDSNRLFSGDFQDEHRIVFKNCDLRNTLLFKDKPPYEYNAKVGSPYVAIRDRFVVFEDCQIDDTTLIEVEEFGFKSGETTMEKKKVLDILKEKPYIRG
jgi:hypothetical protein